MTRNLLLVSDLAPGEITDVLDLAERAALGRPLAGRGAALVFEFPSARTRNAAEMAVVDLGGHPVTIRGEEVGFDVRESVEDVARTLGGYHGSSPPASPTTGRSPGWSRRSPPRGCRSPSSTCSRMWSTRPRRSATC